MTQEIIPPKEPTYDDILMAIARALHANIVQIQNHKTVTNLEWEWNKAKPEEKEFNIGQARVVLTVLGYKPDATSMKVH
jgi:ActR/RegA family two-component response regulator